MLPNRAGLEHASKRFIDNLVTGGLAHYGGVGTPTLVAAETTAQRAPGGTPRNPTFVLADGSRLQPLAGIRLQLQRGLRVRGPAPAYRDVLEYSVRADGEVHFTVLTAAEGPVRVVFDGTDGALIMCTPVTGDEGPLVSGGDDLLPRLPADDDALRDFADALPTHDSVRRAGPRRTRGPARGHRRRPTVDRRRARAAEAAEARRVMDTFLEGGRPARPAGRRRAAHAQLDTAVDRFLERAPRAPRASRAPRARSPVRKRARRAADRDISRPTAPAREPRAPRGAETCAICLDRAVATVCVPCGHMATCVTCAANPQLRGCPVCRERLTSLVRTHAVGRRRPTDDASSSSSEDEDGDVSM